MEYEKIRLNQIVPWKLARLKITQSNATEAQAERRGPLKKVVLPKTGNITTS